MIRKIIEIDQERCNGCGLCAAACHEGAIAMVDGKAQLMREDFCDGLGDCLPACPTGAISFVEREAAAYDVGAVKKAQAEPLPCGCPGTQAKTIARPVEESAACSAQPVESQLRQWPVQLRLVPPSAPYFENAHLLVAADCTAYAYAAFHRDFIRGRVALIGCPKLDPVDYSEKLQAILTNHTIKSIKVVRMEVPCCGGIEKAVKSALQGSGKWIPWQVVTLSSDGRILSD